MSTALDQAKVTFKIEAKELLEQLENAMLELEESPDETERVHEAFRALHTIKGSGAMFGYDEVAEFTHGVENAFDQVRNGELAVGADVISLGLKAHDQIQFLMTESDLDTNPEAIQRQSEVSDLLVKLGEMAKGDSKTIKEVPEEGQLHDIEESANSEGKKSKDGLYRIWFQPSKEFFQGFNPVALLRDLLEFPETVILPQVGEIPSLDEYQPEFCYTSWEVFAYSDFGVSPIEDVFMFAEGACTLNINLVAEIEGIDEEPEPVKKLGEILVERGAVQEGDLQKVLVKQQEEIKKVEETLKTGNLLSEAGLVNDEQLNAALQEQNVIKAVKAKKAESKAEVQAAVKEKSQAQGTVTVRVPSERLDNLMNLIGELTTMQSHIEQFATVKNDPDLDNIAESLSRLSDELRETTMELRMLPIGTIYNKFKRLVRDLSSNLKKEIVLITEGESTELDKTIIEKLNDPLVHIIRNSIDHGIESPEVRLSKGKPAQGTVKLKAVHSGANIVIRIEDDGAGIDTNVIYQKALEKGLVDSDVAMTEQEILNLIFAPGFSTAEKVTSISGRGVGMDVVRSNVEQMRGSIEIKSELGKGSTFILQLPLTLTMVEGLLVKVSESHYVLPLAAVEECVAMKLEDVIEINEQTNIHVRGEIIPFIRLRDLFKIPGEPPEVEQVVISQIGEQRVGFSIDMVVGEHQSVIKPLSNTLKGQGRFSGTTILGDGRVALILNLFELAEGSNMQA